MTNKLQEITSEMQLPFPLNHKIILASQSAWDIQNILVNSGIFRRKFLMNLKWNEDHFLMQLQWAWYYCTISCFYLCQKFYRGKNLEKDQNTQVAENLQKKHFPFILFKPVLSEDRIEQQ